MTDRLLDRATERDAIDEMLTAAARGERRVLVLAGPPGIGKSTLLQYAVESAESSRVLGVAGVESEMALAYAGVHQLVLPLDDGRGGLPGPQRNALDAVLGRTHSGTVDAYLVGLAVLSLVADAAVDRPVLIAVDDAHWLDHESRVVLSFVGRRLHADRVAMIVATRDAPDPSAGFDGAPRLDLGGLDDADARRLLAQSAGAPVDQTVGSRIVAAARGNPLALIELPAALTVEQLGGRAPLPDPLPIVDQFSELYAGRVEALDPEARFVALLAAAERLADPAVVRRAAATVEDARWHEVLGRVEASGLVTFDSTVEFRHPLARSGVYYSASPAERRRAHTALAAALDDDADADRRAWHLGAAATVADEGVARALQEAADRAGRRGGAAMAATYLWRAVELTSDPVLANGRLLEAARAALAAGQGEQVRHALERARAAGLRVEQRADAGWTEALLHLVGGQLRPAASLLAGELPQVSPADGELAVGSCAAADAVLLAGGHLVAEPTRRAIAEGVMTVARGHDAGEPLASLLQGVAARVTDGGDVAAAMLGAAVSATRADQLQLRQTAGRHVHVVYFDAVLAACDLLDEQAWDELSDGWAQLARATGALAALPLALSLRAWLEVLQGRLGSATSHLAEIEELTSLTGWRGLLGTPAPALLLHTAWQGDEESARSQVRHAMRDAHERGQGIGIDHGYLALTVLELGAGRYDAALRNARRVLEHDNLGLAPLVLADLVEAAARCGETDLAADAVERLAGLAGRSRTPWAAGLLARSRAVLQAGDAADESFRVATAELARSSMATDTARAQLLHGEWLRRNGRRKDAREQLHEALELFERIGATAFAGRARAELAATGEHLRRRPAPAQALTPQEAQIARLAASGERNREIAAQLYISTSTVEYHLKKVYVKLGVSSRTQLANVDLPT